MSLDQNLFTLSIAPNKDDPNVIDLVDNSLTPITHYRKQRVPGQVYKIEVYGMPLLCAVPFYSSLLKWPSPRSLVRVASHHSDCPERHQQAEGPRTIQSHQSRGIEVFRNHFIQVDIHMGTVSVMDRQYSNTILYAHT